MARDDFQQPVAPRITIRGARAAFVGPSLELAPHRNAVAVLAIALQAPFELTVAGDEPRRATAIRAELIRAGVMHQLRATGDMVFVYLDALSDDLEALRTSELDRLQAAFVRRCDPWRADADEICAALDVPQRREGNSALAEVVRAIDERPQDFPRIDPAAALAGLSVSRFRHVFSSVTGVPFRRYRQWRRMAVVMRVLADGGTLTTAAHEAGFSSSAHFSTAFRTMFGIPPSSLIDVGTRFDLD